MAELLNTYGRLIAEGKDLRVLVYENRHSLQNADLAGADLSWRDLRKANLYGADLCGADLSHANLYHAELRYANLSSANLFCANLSYAILNDACLDGVTMNWGSHELIAEILRQRAGDDVDCRKIAGYVLVSRDMCWDRFLEQDDPCRAWALGVLSEFVQPDDDAPKLLRQLAAARPGIS